MKYQSRETIEAIGFQELVGIGLAAKDANLVNGVPWSFHYNGWPVTHEDNNTYLIGTGFDHIRFRRGSFLAIGSGNELFTLSPEDLAQNYTPLDPPRDAAVTEDEDPDGNVYIAPPESELEAIKKALES